MGLHHRSSQARQIVSIETRLHIPLATKKRDSATGSWELYVGLERGPGVFGLKYHAVKVIDRDPEPGANPQGNITVTLGAAIDARAELKLGAYHPPAGGLTVTPDIELMHYRFMRYLRGRETLATMANLCLTTLEKGTGATKGKRPAAASKYGVELAVLDRLGDLAANAGGRDARKYDGVNRDFTSAEEQWIEKAVKMLIRRAAEVAYDPTASRRPITMADLPTLTGSGP